MSDLQNELNAMRKRAEEAESELQGFRAYVAYQRTTDHTPPLTYDLWCEWQYDMWRRERDGQWTGVADE